MHNMPIDFLAVSLVTLAVLQGLSILLTNLEIAAKQIEGRSTWIARDGTVFEEFAVSGNQFLRSSSPPTCSKPSALASASVREWDFELLRKLVLIARRSSSSLDVRRKRKQARLL
jgi:hypothetical protein